MIQCFLLPELMIERKEAPNALREDEVVIELTPDGRHRPIRRGGNEMDPVYELFMPSHPEQQGAVLIEIFVNYKKNLRFTFKYAIEVTASCYHIMILMKVEFTLLR